MDARKRGRPPKAPEKGRRQNYTFRMSDETRDHVIDAAARSGRSMSEELERIVEAHFQRADTLALMQQAVRAALEADRQAERERIRTAERERLSAPMTAYRAMLGGGTGQALQAALAGQYAGLKGN